MSHAAPPGPGKKPEKPPNHERWVISYADLLTLLLATFVVLYASSTRNKHKLDQEAAGFIKAFHGTPAIVDKSGGSRGVMSHQPSPIPQRQATPAAANAKIPRQLTHQIAAEMQSLDKLRLQLTSLLHPELEAHQVSVQSQPLTLTIQLDASVLFASGTAALKPPAAALLHQVAASLTKLPAPFTIVVQGYTDNQPIATAAFPSNWALSAGRAVSVVQLFGDAGVPGTQLAAEGFGEFRPVAPNDTDAHRAQNRRVVVVIHAPDPALGETDHGP
jgi:chemotaxis protein MotB